MKDKILAILNAQTDQDIKVDLLDTLMRVTAQEYKTFSNERDELLFSVGGLNLFEADCNLPPTELWERFVIAMKEKYKK